MHVAERFAAPSAEVTVAEINRIRLGTLVTPDFDATPIPWVAERGSGDGIVLWGHLALRNPQVEPLRSAPEVLVVFNGLNGYISPRWLPTPRSAPTWNYTAVHICGPCRLLDEPETEFAVEKLVAAEEGGRPTPWRTVEMGPRRGQLLRHVIGVRVEAVKISAKFKLGQNESPVDLAATLAALAREGRQDLAEAMRQACL